MAQDMGRSVFKLKFIKAVAALALLLAIISLLSLFSAQSIPVNLLLRNILQASLSAVFAVLLAFPLAYSLTKKTPFSKLLGALSLIPLVLPQPVMILSMIVLFGTNGYLKMPFSLYGLEGIVLAHSLYNFPLAARIIAAKWNSLQSLEGVSRVLGANRINAFIRVTLPSLRESLFSGFLVAFAYSFTSFAIPMVFGGVLYGTVEVEIFRSFFRDFEFTKGIYFALLQLALFVPLALAWKSVPWHLEGLTRKGSNFASLISFFYLLIFGAILLGPIARVKVSPVSLTPIFNSLLLALFSAIICIFLWVLLGKYLTKYLFLLFAISPAVLAVAFYFLPYSFFLLPLGHALLALPLVSALLLPFTNSIEEYLRAAASFGANRIQRLRFVYFPLISSAFILAFLFSFAFSLGETAFLLSLAQEYNTMSIVLLQAFSVYRFGEGYFYAVILIALSFIVAFLIEGFNVFESKNAKKV